MMAKTKQVAGRKSRISVKGPSLAETLRLKIHRPSIAELFPTLIEKYWAEQNVRNPSEITPGSGIHTYWICPNSPSHPIYSIATLSRVRSWLEKTESQCCPRCKSSDFTKAVEALPGWFLSMLIPSKNCGRSEFKYLTTFSRKTVLVRCPDCSKPYSAVIGALWAGDVSCPTCYTGPRIDLREVENKEGMSFHNATAFFNHGKNQGVDLRRFPLQLKVWWTCPSYRTHNFYATLREVCNEKEEVFCKTCHPVDRVDLSAEAPQLVREFCLQLNEGHKIDFLKRNGIYYWNCSNGHGYKRKLSERLADDRGCPVCIAGALINERTLACYSGHALCFDEQRNGVKASGLQACGRKARSQKWWWNCQYCLGSWQETQYSFLRQSNTACPGCRKKPDLFD